MIDHYSEIDVCEFLICPLPTSCGRLVSGHLKKSVVVKASGYISTCRELASRISTSRLGMVVEFFDSSRSSCLADLALGVAVYLIGSS